MGTSPAFSQVGLIGTGAMGQGIAQLSAQAGAKVLLLDTREGAAQQAVDKIKALWASLSAKGRLTDEQAAKVREFKVATVIDNDTGEIQGAEPTHADAE